MMKKIISVFLTLAMCLSLTTFAFAGTSFEAAPQDEVLNMNSNQRSWAIQTDVVSQILEEKQSRVPQSVVNNINVEKTINALSKVYLQIEECENSGNLQDTKRISALYDERDILEVVLANNGQHILSNEEVASIIRGSSFEDKVESASALSTNAVMIRPEDTANNKWICSDIKTLNGCSYYTLTVMPLSANSSLYETHTKNTDGRLDWADYSTKLLFHKVVDSVAETVNFGLLGTLMGILEDINDTTNCHLTYNIAVTSYPKFTFVCDEDSEAYLCTLITHSANISQVIIANVPNLSSNDRTELSDKLLVTTNHNAPARLAVSRFSQGNTWSEVERVGYCNVFCQKGSSGAKVSITGFEPPYATGVYTVH